jgi:hypothetical protein
MAKTGNKKGKKGKNNKKKNFAFFCSFPEIELPEN